MDVRETFLNDTEEGHFRLLTEPPDVLRYVEFDREAAALAYALYVPTNCFGQARLVQEWRVQ